MGSRILRAARRYDTSAPRALARFARFYFMDRFSPTEIFLLGLLNAGPGFTQFSPFISKQRMLEAQLAVNPREFFDRTEDKLCFALFCAKHRLATPRILATIGATPSLANTSEHLQGSADLLHFLQQASACELILKPTHGVHGQGILRLHCNEGQVCDDDGRTLAVRDLDIHLRSADYHSWLLQELLLPHAMLSALSGTPHVQTVRVVTILDDFGEAHIAAAWLRLIGGDAKFDNFNFGQSGNLLSTIDIASGRIMRTLAAGEDGLGLVEVAVHPKTQHPFSSLSLPDWRDTQDLAKAAAMAFEPLVTIGWDIAITDKGPVLIEGNVTWDPLPGCPDLSAIYKRLLKHRRLPATGAYSSAQS
jgi:hypothetical protein